MSRTRIVHILHTNDLHSHFERMAQISACLKAKRAVWEAQGDLVLTVDVGDHVDRSRTISEATWGQANVEILNRSGYQYVTIGNNEGLTLPKERLNRLYEHATFTVVLGNFADSATVQPPLWAAPYAIHEWDGLRIAMLGVTAAFGSFYRQLGWEVSDPLPLLKRQVQALRPQVDLIIVLSHLGYWADKQLAAEVEGIDVILGGHTHHLLEQGERVGSTLLAQVGKFGEYVGHVQLLVDQERRQILAKEAQLIRVSDFVADPEVEQILREEQLAAEQALSQPVATLSMDLDVDWQRESPFATLLAASLRRWTGAEIGIANSGLSLKPLRRGAVTRKDLLECVPHAVKPCALTLRGEQLLAVLRRSLQPQTISQPLRGFGFRGKLMGWMGIDGVTVHYSDGEHPVVTQIDVAGQPLAEERMYRVATIDMFLFNHLFPEFHQGQDQRFYLPEVLREVLAAALADDDLIRDCCQPRWICS